MHLLIFGSTGQVAREIARKLAGGPITAEFLSRTQADLATPGICAQHIATTKADVILNAAAYTAVDQAEVEPDLAHQINATAPGEMAHAAAARAIPFIHISTDYVFDGTSSKPWLESDQPNPQTHYGKSKYAGEQQVIAAGGVHVILRTAWVFSAHGQNFVKTMRRLWADGRAVKVVQDQWGGPTAAADIAAALLEIARSLHRGQGENGIYHYCGAPRQSWAEFAEAIFAQASLARATGAGVTGIPAAEYPSTVARPENSMLECRKIHQHFNIEQPDWRVSLAKVLNELEADHGA